MLIAVAIGAIFGWLLVWTGRPPIPMAGDCISSGCHNVVNKKATMYVAVNQQVLSSGETVTVEAGKSFELDFYFEDMVGMQKRFPIIGRFFDAEPYTAVGTELIVDPEWDVMVGTVEGPEGWSGVWQRGASGIGELRMTSWQPTSRTEGRYYLDFRASPWTAFANMPALATDTGNVTVSDLDVVAGRMGADAVIRIPEEASPGQYEVRVAGIGHTGGGKRSHVSRTISVDVTAADVAESGPIVFEGARLYARLCSSCHEDTPQEKGKLVRRGADWAEHVIQWGTGTMAPVRGLNDLEISAVVDYIEATGAMVEKPIPDVPHAAAEGQACLVCHGPSRIVPAPRSHVSFGTSICLSCHQVSDAVAGIGVPKVPHPGEGRACLDCHSTGGIVPMTATHEGRKNDICLACHQVVPDMAGVAVVEAPHRVSASAACTACHGFDGPVPMSQSHVGREDMICVACHDADSAAIATTPVMPHPSEGRESCQACHSPAGWVPAPEDHWGRPEETCLVCHQ